jgi:hypothetical protein
MRLNEIILQLTELRASLPTGADPRISIWDALPEGGGYSYEVLSIDYVPDASNGPRVSINRGEHV